MDSFVLVWILVIYGNSYHSISYSPPVKTLKDCQRMQSALPRYKDASRCVQVNMLTSK